MILLDVLILVVGFVALVKGADWFVDGSAALAKNFRVPGLIIGLTVVALGTSAPELAVSTTAAIQGSNEIALSNVVGSNIFNLLCVLGFCAVIHPVPVDKIVLKRDFPISIVAAVFVLAAAVMTAIRTNGFADIRMDADAGMISRWAGVVLFVCFIAYLVYLVQNARKYPEPEEEGENKPIWKCLLLIVIGLVLIVGGGQAVVYSAKEIARAAGMTETLIGLTIVAVGTSLPELVTSITAAKKGETGLAVGNAIGSNIFNLMLILGLSTMIHPIVVNWASVFDLGILIAVSLITILFSISKFRITRREGIIMIALYVADVVFAIVR
ncbi:MAG: calcium/sodium antiporter [Eubacterium sp.]|nr:calcium/sodium antiporter [Eubacterium sp.]